MDCDRVTDNLFVGSCVLNGKDFEDLRSLGTTAILSLQTPEDTGERGIEWEEKAALNAKLAFRSVPVRDFDSADLQRNLPRVSPYSTTCSRLVIPFSCTARRGRAVRLQWRSVTCIGVWVASGSGFGACLQLPGLHAQRGSYSQRSMAAAAPQTLM
jgi:hypothetical protein